MTYPGMYTIGNPSLYGAYLPSGTFGLMLTFGMDYLTQIYVTRDNIWYRLSTNDNIEEIAWTKVL